MNLLVSSSSSGHGKRTQVVAARWATVLNRIKKIMPCSSSRSSYQADAGLHLGYGYGPGQGDGCSNAFVEDRTKKKNVEKESIWKRLSPRSHRVHAAVTEAMRNYLILKQIFKNVTCNDLKRFRLVCKGWCLHATDALVYRKECKLTIGNELFFRRPTLTFADLISTANNSTGLPITSLNFTQGTWGLELEARDQNLHHNHYLSHQLITFLKVAQAKKYIKSLQFDCGDHRRSVQVFQNILNYLPNIEHMEINSISVSGPITADFERDVHPLLANLKSLRINWKVVKGQERFLTTILRAAVSLERIEGFFNPELMPVMTGAVVATNKFYAIKELYFFNNNQDCYSKLAAGNLQLNTLRVISGIVFSGEIPPEAVASLNKILQSSRNSLKKLCVYATFGVKDVHIPILQNLVYLRYRFVRGQKALFPPEIPPAQHFPSLKIVNLELENLYKDSVRNLFPGEGFRGQGQVQYTNYALPSVRELKINCGVDFHGIRLISQIFPNLTRVRLMNAMNKFQVNGWVWFLPDSMESIEIHGLVLEQGISFDSFFTGISEKDCKKLRGLKLKSDAVIGCARKRALKDFKNLKKLKICFDHPQNSKWKRPTEKEKGHPVISRLSGCYGFGSVPYLDVVVAYDHYYSGNSRDIATTFEPIRPFVKFAQEQLKCRPRWSH